ncbi:hypothetical protein BGX34_003297 [Mortierella sp. NVP85]|nr:hypothetical protein BGX34_003297 [Mortierella sp. NVP85]
MSEPILPVDSVPTTPSHDPNAIPHDRTVKQLESRLQFVEDAYMSLRGFVQELQNIQHTQDQTMIWMRERIEQLTEASTPRDVMTSPPLAGAVPSKRKAEYSPGDSREWRRPHPDHPSSMYSRHGPAPPGPASIAQASSQGPSPGGHSPRVRYEPPNFHSSFNPVHHPPPPAPRTPPMQQQQLSQQQQQQQQQAPQAQSGSQRQHPSPPMGSSHPHYQKASVTSMLHD